MMDLLFTHSWAFSLVLPQSADTLESVSDCLTPNRPLWVTLYRPGAGQSLPSFPSAPPTLTRICFLSSSFPGALLSVSLLSSSLGCFLAGGPAVAFLRSWLVPGGALPSPPLPVFCPSPPSCPSPPPLPGSPPTRLTLALWSGRIHACCLAYWDFNCSTSRVLDRK